MKSLLPAKKENDHCMNRQDSWIMDGCLCALDGAGMAGNDASQGLKERLINMHQRKGKTDTAPKPCCQCIPQRNRNLSLQAPAVAGELVT
jgi:hypothetical protein